MMLDRIDQDLVAWLRPGLSGAHNSMPDAPADWQAFIARAEQTGLAPLLYLALQKDNPVKPPESMRQELRQAYLKTMMANLIVSREAARLLELFSREQIPVILLKGIALANSLYADPGLRVLSDVDLLVHFADREQVHALMKAQSYVSQFNLEAGLGTEYTCEQAYTRSKPTLAVEIHWHILNSAYLRRNVMLDWFWQNTIPIQINKQTGYMFAPGAQLAHLTSHYFLHHQGLGLRWSYDIALLLNRHGTEINWLETLAAARKFGINRALSAGLMQAVQVWGKNLPAEAYVAMHRYPPTLSDRIAFRILTSPRPEAGILWDAWNTSGICDKVMYLARYVFPKRAYMMERYKITKDQVSWFYVRRIFRGLGLLARSLVSIAGNSMRVLLR
jgi:hypothetical protein